MTSILGLTDTDAVRAAIGIAEESGELDDEVFSDLGIGNLLKLELADWLPDYKSIRDDPLAEIEDTAEELKLLLLQGFSTYWCAYTMSLSSDISFALRQEDGQNKMIRQTRDVEELLNRLLTRALQYKSRLLAILSPPPTLLTNWFVGSAAPNYDPVTNATTG
ncbi:MAG: hypothetical protein EOM21_18645 [Gammaproteobacteria bacterium]|nr:hypothetical protein [Gammaproteobacteria bacterium]